MRSLEDISNELKWRTFLTSLDSDPTLMRRLRYMGNTQGMISDDTNLP